MSLQGPENGSVPRNVLRKQIRQEYKNYQPRLSIALPENRPGLKLMFFNNLPLKFPVVVDDPNHMMSMGLQRIRDQRPAPDAHAYLHSSLYFLQTHGEYIETIRGVIERLGLGDKAAAAYIKHEAVKTAKEQNQRDIDEIADVYLEIYTELRLMGYAHDDITE